MKLSVFDELLDQTFTNTLDAIPLFPKAHKKNTMKRKTSFGDNYPPTKKTFSEIIPLRPIRYNWNNRTINSN